jgi:23S rRNA (guanine745-N1)-methyltransferase
VADLLCTVRNCRSLLVREERRYVCARSHSFDIARSGYVNLLQPQERRSRNPGDTAEAVAARRRIADRGTVEPFVAPMIEMIGSAESLLDVGCGEGYHLGAFQKALDCDAHGTDISTAAIDLAARRYRDCTWTVANADRFLPYESVDVITSITSRLNAVEFARVARRVLIALPAADDLIELRETVLGEGKLIDRVERTVRDFAAFELVKHEKARFVIRLDRAAVADMLASSYRGLRTSQRERMNSLHDATVVTLSRDLLLFRAL